MAISDYVELRCRSAFSFLDGASLPEDLVSAAAAGGHDTLALADVNGLYGAPRFYAAAQRAGLRAIVGAEVRLEVRLEDTAARAAPRPRRAHVRAPRRDRRRHWTPAAAQRRAPAQVSCRDGGAVPRSAGGRARDSRHRRALRVHARRSRIHVPDLPGPPRRDRAE